MAASITALQNGWQCYRAPTLPTIGRRGSLDDVVVGRVGGGSAERAPLRWPFVGRAAEQEAVGVALQRSAGLLVAGPAGVGKSSLVRSVTHANGGSVQWCMASPATQRIPFGAVAPLLLFAGVEAPDPTRYLIAARAALATGDRPPTVVVDDAPLLDRASVVLLSQLFHEQRVRLVLIARDGQPLAVELARLVDDGVMEEVRVAPLGPDDCAAAVELALGGPLHSDAAAALAERSAGNPLLLRELVLAAHSTGVLYWRRGWWVLTGELPISDRLVDVIARRLATADPAVQRAVALVALGAPLPLSVASTALPPSELADVERLGLVEVVSERAGPALQITHPLVGEAVLRGTPTSTRRDLVALLSELLDADRTPEPDVALRWCVERLDVGISVPSATLARAAQQAFGFLDHPLAVRLAEAALAHGPHFESLLTLGAARSAQLDVEGGGGDRKSVVLGRMVDLGGLGIIK
ncbi:MAG TPA: hypothetical protein DCR14_13850 [Acidimicrobiaceae bacterium]|nr:hypothetical protein [Acidimicrobiaceae bacterium]